MNPAKKGGKMSESNQLDRTFQIIMKHLMETGKAPHYTEIAAGLNVPLEEGRKALHELFSSGLPAWLFPNTDYICSFHNTKRNVAFQKYIHLFQ